MVLVTNMRYDHNNNNNNNDNDAKQNMGEPERPTNGSASLTVKRASLIDCQVFFNISPHLGYFSPSLGYFEQQCNGTFSNN